MRVYLTNLEVDTERGAELLDLCLRITEDGKLDLILAAVESLVVPAPDAPEYWPFVQRLVSRAHCPPVPPPREA